jgi:hypothetical protein
MKNSIRFTLLSIALGAFAGCQKSSPPTEADPKVAELKLLAVQLKKQAASTEEKYRVQVADMKVMHEKGLALQKKRQAMEVGLLKVQVKRLEAQRALAEASASVKALETPPIPSDWRSPEECRRLEAKLKAFTKDIVNLDMENKLNEQKAGEIQRKADEIHKDAVGLELQNELNKRMAEDIESKISTRR